MKKNGRKGRRLQKEKTERIEATRAKMKVGEPFSKAKTRKKLCLHYEGTPGGFTVGYCYSLLIPRGKTECICAKCGKVFPIEKHDQMKQLVRYLSNKGCITDVAYIMKLSKGIEPVYYRRISENEIEILETVEDKCILPSHTFVTL